MDTRNKNYIFMDSGVGKMVAIAGIFRGLMGIFLLVASSKIAVMLIGGNYDFLYDVLDYSTYRQIAYGSETAVTVTTLLMLPLILYPAVLFLLLGIGSIKVLARRPSGASLCRSCFAQLRVMMVVLTVIINVGYLYILISSLGRSGIAALILLGILAVTDVFMVLGIKYYGRLRDAMDNINIELSLGSIDYASTGRLTGIAIALGITQLVFIVIQYLNYGESYYRSTYANSNRYYYTLLSYVGMAIYFLIAFANSAFKRHIYEKSAAKKSSVPYYPSFRPFINVLGAVAVGWLSTYALCGLVYLIVDLINNGSYYGSYYHAYYTLFIPSNALHTAAYIVFTIGFKSRRNAPKFLAAGFIMLSATIYTIVFQVTNSVFSINSFAYFNWIMLSIWEILLVVSCFVAIAKSRRPDYRGLTIGLRIPLMALAIVTFSIYISYYLTENIGDPLMIFVDVTITGLGLAAVSWAVGQSERLKAKGAGLGYIPDETKPKIFVEDKPAEKFFE